MRRSEEKRKEATSCSAADTYIKELLLCSFARHSDESTYDRPSEFATVADPFGSSRGGVVRGIVSPQQTTATTPSVPAGVLSVRREEEQLPVENLNGEWMKYIDPESGHPYYYHEESDER